MYEAAVIFHRLVLDRGYWKIQCETNHASEETLTVQTYLASPAPFTTSACRVDSHMRGTIGR
jgi:hypothetical protein